MRRRILQAATHLFVEKGFEKTSIRNVAEAIEYSPATIYLYFKDKNELFYAISLEAFTCFGQYLQSAREVDEPMERLKALGRTYFRFAYENPSYYDLMFIMREPMDTEKTSDAWEAGMRGHQVLIDTVADCMAAGYFKEKDPDVLAMVIWGFVHGIVSLRLRCRMRMLPPEEREAMLWKALDMFNQMLREM